jgi:hypothetical protein
MARRYIGNVTLYVTYADSGMNPHYKVKACCDTATYDFTILPANNTWTIASDSPEAYDRMASTAAWFCISPDGDNPSKAVAAEFEEHLASGLLETGEYEVRRRKEK